MKRFTIKQLLLFVVALSIICAGIGWYAEFNRWRRIRYDGLTEIAVTYGVVQGVQVRVASRRSVQILFELRSIGHEFSSKHTLLATRPTLALTYRGAWSVQLMPDGRLKVGDHDFTLPPSRSERSFLIPPPDSNRLLESRDEHLVATFVESGQAGRVFDLYCSPSFERE